MSKHTPGPWLVDNGHDGRSKGYIRASMTPGVLSIANVTTSRREWEWNAALIAAAPDMLEALKQVQALTVEYGPEDDMTKKIAAILEGAIAKAEKHRTGIY